MISGETKSMRWINEPGNWSEENGRITVHTEPGSDIWRQPIESGIRDSAHRYLDTVEGDFRASVKFQANYTGLYDQIGLFVGASDTVWMKCGVEYVDSIKHASAVVTREWSDWSILALDDPEWVWILVERHGPMLYVKFSLDGSHFYLLRKAYFSEQAELDVGIMAGSPKCDGITAVFEDLEIVNI